MAILYDAVLEPTKLDLLSSWLPTQPWFDGGAAALEPVGSYRFDDPDGEVGIETHLVRAGSRIFHAPLTYRDAPLEGGAEWLIGTMEHSVLGRRWIYDACGDAVYAAALAATLLAGRPQASQFVDVDGQLEEVPSSVRIRATGRTGAAVPGQVRAEPETAGDVTTIRTGTVPLAVQRVLDLGGTVDSASMMTGTWDGNTTPVRLAWIPEA